MNADNGHVLYAQHLRNADSRKKEQIMFVPTTFVLTNDVCAWYDHK